jgi:predicted nucleotidyltransferase component of viral defense system
LAASVRQRLYNKGQLTGRPFDELLQYYGIERFLYRLSRSQYKDRVVLKGALIFVVWQAPQSRVTRDIDLLGKFKNTIQNLESMVREACQLEVEPDGLIFDPRSVAGRRIKEDADYAGVRVRFLGRLDRARIPMQIDVGFGDSIYPEPPLIQYPSLLGMPGARLKGYPPETVIAEKFQAMSELEMLNTRMKDFYDVWLMARQFDFHSERLAEAIRATFENRKALLSVEPVAFSEEFAKSPVKQQQWAAFIRKTHLQQAPAELQNVIPPIRRFLQPIVEAVLERKRVNLSWTAPGPWR